MLRPIAVLRSLLVLASLILAAGCSDSGGGGDSGNVVIDTNPPGATLDGTFGGGNGRVILSASESEVVHILEDASGNLVAAGRIIEPSGNTLVAVWRLLDDGEFDTTFGTGGVATLDPSAASPDDDHLCDVTIDGTGRIVVAGTTDGVAGDRDIFVARLLANGTPDATFGTGGGIVTAGNDGVTDHDDIAAELIVDSTGRVVVAGTSRVTGSMAGGEAALWRFLSIGLPDPNFATAGLFLSGGMDESVGGMLVDSTNALLVSGAQGDSLTLWLVDSDGDLDPTFGVGGIAVIGNGGGALISGRMRGYGATTVVVAGRRTSPTEADRMYVTRVLTNGMLETSFGDNGLFTFATSNGDSSGTLPIVAPLGQIVVTGETTLRDFGGAASVTAGALWLLTADGVLDTSLAGSGIVHLSSITDASTSASTGLIDSASRVVAAGSVDSGSGISNAVVWRVP